MRVCMCLIQLMTVDISKSFGKSDTFVEHCYIYIFMQFVAHICINCCALRSIFGLFVLFVSLLLSCQIAPFWIRPLMSQYKFVQLVVIMSYKDNKTKKKTEKQLWLEKLQKYNKLLLKKEGKKTTNCCCKILQKIIVCIT